MPGDSTIPTGTPNVSEDPPDPSPPGIVAGPPAEVYVGETFSFSVDKLNVSTLTMSDVRYVFTVGDESSTASGSTTPIVLPDGAGSGFDETLDMTTSPIQLILRPQVPSSGDTLGPGERVVFAFDSWRAQRAGVAVISMFTQSNEFAPAIAQIGRVNVLLP